MALVDVISNVSFYIFFALAFVAKLFGGFLYGIGSFIFNVLYTIATPFIFAASLTVQVLSIPWRIFAQFEALWYFLAFAAGLGVFSGLVIHLMLRACAAIFNLDQEPAPKDIPAKGHNAASYRASREEKRRKEEDKRQRLEMRAKLLASQPLIQEVVREARQKPISGPTHYPQSPNTSTAATKRGLFYQTILEHEEEDSAF